MKYKNNKEIGAVSIPLVMGIGILLFLVVISITSVETARIYLVQANIDGAQSLEYAKSGVRDGLEKIARDKMFGASSTSYEINMEENGCEKYKYCSMITVSPYDVGSTSGRIISSIGYYKSARKGLQVQILFDENNLGEIKIIDTKETLSPIGF